MKPHVDIMICYITRSWDVVTRTPFIYLTFNDRDVNSKVWTVGISKFTGTRSNLNLSIMSIRFWKFFRFGLMDHGEDNDGSKKEAPQWKNHDQLHASLVAWMYKTTISP